MLGFFWIRWGSCLKGLVTIKRLMCCYPSYAPAEILIVDDNACDVRLIKEAFKEGGIVSKFHVTPDGEQAMAFLRREGPYSGSPRPSLILLDLNLPRKSGREVLAEIKSEQSLRRIPVVVLSASTSHEDVGRAYELQANCYIPKPADLAGLIDLGRLLQKLWLNPALLAG